MSYSRRDKRTGEVYFLPIKVDVQCLPPELFEEVAPDVYHPFWFDVGSMRADFEKRLKDLTGTQYFTDEEFKKFKDEEDERENL